MTLLRNATTKKNRHCYGVKLSTDSNILLRDLEKPVTAINADTYVSTAKDILKEIE